MVNPLSQKVILLMNEILHQLKLVGSLPLFTRTHPGGCLRFLPSTGHLVTAMFSHVRLSEGLLICTNCAEANHRASELSRH